MIEPVATTEAPGPPQMSAAARLIGVLFSPVRTFQDIARQPTSWQPLLVLIVLNLVVSAVFINPRMDYEKGAEQQAQMLSERFGVKMTDAQIDQSVEQAKKTGPIKGYTGAILGPLIATLFFALV